MATPMIPGGPHANGGIPILVAPQQPYIPTSVSQGSKDNLISPECPGERKNSPKLKFVIANTSSTRAPTG